MWPALQPSSHRLSPLGDWRYTSLPAGAAQLPEQLASLPCHWLPAPVPGTAASALRDAGAWSLDGPPRDFDAEDGWWTCRFTAPPSPHSLLRFEGLATLAEVWLNGHKILDSDNQFLAHEVPVSAWLQAENQLHIRCAALAPVLKAKRPRPRWRTRLVAQQQLRWHRTSLLGRIPGWSPPVVATGPWRAVTLVQAEQVRVLHADLRSSLHGRQGQFDASVQLALDAGLTLHSAQLQVGSVHGPLHIRTAEDGSLHLHSTLHLPEVAQWWPHSHGIAALHAVNIVLDCGTHRLTLNAGDTGFRQLHLHTDDNGFALTVNGLPIFCRGACWTPLDIASQSASPAQLAEALDQAVAAGFNLLRVGGTMGYESNAFYQACDQRGLMVWQDYAFANMDYPGDDPAFAASVQREASQFLARSQLNPALCLLCGNSEIEQQAAMLGLPEALWRAPLFAQQLPALGAQLRPDVPYWPSSPAGGSLPFHTDTGLSHYYGVGAYLRPLSDARHAALRFTSECLAFANVPEPETLELILADGEAPPQHPRWKARVPRDSGPAWDFDDVRDHYLGQFYALDVAKLRYANLERYLYLSRLVTGELMAASLSEWRRSGSSCQGALVWFNRDLWPGAGWGLVDATGLPKAPWYFMRRVCAPTALLCTDEGLNGLALHAINDPPSPLPVTVSLSLYRGGDVLVAQGQAQATLPGHGSLSWRGDALIGHFTDLTHAYRFGPPGHDVAIAQLHHAETGALLGQAVHIPDQSALAAIGDPGLVASASPLADGAYALTISTRKYANGVWVEARGYAASDNYFHLAPGSSHTVQLRPRHGKARLQAYIHCTTSSGPVRATLAALAPSPP